MPYSLILDLGSSSTKAIIAQKNGKNGWQVVFPALRKSRGIKQGMVANLEELTKELDNFLTEMEAMNKNFAFRRAIVGISGPHLEIRFSKGVSVVSRPDGEVTEDDKERAYKAAEACILPPNRVLVQTVLRNYIIDGVTKIKDPIGMKGLRLEVECLLVDAFSPVILNLDRLGEMLGMKLNPKIIIPFCGAEIALSPQDKELGSVAIDLGAGTTSLCLYEDSELLDLKVFPLGGNNITNDIAVGLRTYVDVAEKIKIAEGVAIAKKVSKGEVVDLESYWEEADKDSKINKRFLAEIMEARLSEIFDLIGDRLKQLNRFGKLPGGVVLYGGGAKIPFVSELAKEKFKLPVKIAKPEIEWYKENPDPIFIPVLGLANFELQEANERETIFEKEGIFKRLINSIYRFFST